MKDFTRRSLLQGGTALAATGVLTGPALLDFARAWAQTAPWKAEPGAKLTVMRWKRFVPAEDDAFNAMIAAFKNGYETPVAERGGNFSAGERQLLTFTRALVAQPRLLILDEATSAVDSKTEQLIQTALEKLFASRTCFVIAHRLSTVRNAHRIYVLQHGEIIESGSHEELLARGSAYSKLHEEFVRH